MSTAHQSLSAHDAHEMPNAGPYRFGIVVAEWNHAITEALAQGAISFLKEAGASFEVSDENDLLVKIDTLLAEQQLRINMGQKALKVVENQTGAINKNIEIIKRYINE